MAVATGAPLTLDDLRGRIFLTAAETAGVYRLDMDTCLKALRNGEIPGRKIGHQWRIPAAQVLALLGGEAA